MFSVLKMSDQSIGLIVQRVTFQGLAGWDQYPCGRWGDSQNPSYAALTDYQFMRPRSRDKKLQEWASTLRSLEDIHERFKNYCLGKLKSSPWSELEGLQPETKVKEEQLGQINSKGFLTINSQPAVNGVNPASPLLIRGWGGPGGYVYQKAYLEFFCSAEKLNHLVEKCNSLPSLTYIAVNKEGHCLSNVGPNGVNAVTWGVFPAKEIIQPTVVDPASFMVSGRMRYLRYGRENGHACSLRMILRG